ncbi:MAG: hypothetical protein E6G40_13260, partial [Actinobacteria bacterium]
LEHPRGGGEPRPGRAPRDKGVALVIHAQTSGEVIIGASQVGRVHEAGSTRVQVDHEHVATTAAGRLLECPCGRGEIG